MLMGNSVPLTGSWLAIIQLFLWLALAKNPLLTRNDVMTANNSKLQNFFRGCRLAVVLRTFQSPFWLDGAT